MAVAKVKGGEYKEDVKSRSKWPDVEIDLVWGSKEAV